MKTKLIECGAIFLMGTSVLLYGCSQDDLFEEDAELRNLATRIMQEWGENQGAFGELDTYKMGEGTSSEQFTTPDGTFTIAVNWTAGYPAGVHDSNRKSMVTATVSSVNDRISNMEMKDMEWENFYRIKGKLVYDVKRKVKVNGVTREVTFRDQEFGFTMIPKNIRIVNDRGSVVFSIN